MSRTFDKISRQYLKEVLKAFDFHPTRIHWIYSIVSTSFFSILVNGVLSPTFKASHDICQGDSLSLFLFILMEEGLSRSISSGYPRIFPKRSFSTWYQPSSISHPVCGQYKAHGLSNGLGIPLSQKTYG